MCNAGIATLLFDFQVLLNSFSSESRAVLIASVMIRCPGGRDALSKEEQSARFFGHVWPTIVDCRHCQFESWQEFLPRS